MTSLDIIEETAPGREKMDITWMTTFLEVFTDCIIETDAQFIITNIRRKTGSFFSINDIVGRPFLEIASEKDRAFVTKELELLKTTDLPYRRFIFLSRIGRYFRWTLMPLYKNNLYKYFKIYLKICQAILAFF